MIEEIKSKLRKAINYLEHHNHNSAVNIIETLKDDVEEILQPHWDIQSSDEQYSDPDLWDYEPIYDGLVAAYDSLSHIDMFYIEEEGYDNSDKKDMNNARKTLQDVLNNI